MNFQHKDLASGQWQTMPFVEQMAHVGSEIERALNWRAKNNPEYSHKACERALELLYLTIESANDYPKLKELTRVREAWLDYFYGNNDFNSTDLLWKKYFQAFNYAARIRT